MYVFILICLSVCLSVCVKNIRDLGKRVERAWNSSDIGRRSRKNEVSVNQKGSMALAILAYRHPQFQLWNVVGPIFIMCVLNFISYGLDEEETADRLGLNFTLLLTITAYKQAVADNLARVPMLTVLDKYILRAFLFMAFICIQQVSFPGSYGWLMPALYFLAYHIWFVYDAYVALEEQKIQKDHYSIDGDVVIDSTMEEVEESSFSSPLHSIKKKFSEFVDYMWPEFFLLFILVVRYLGYTVVILIFVTYITFCIQTLRNALSAISTNIMMSLQQSSFCRRIYNRVLNQLNNNSFPRVLLFDCGSGETKWMVYGATNDGIVQIFEGENYVSKFLDRAISPFGQTLNVSKMVSSDLIFDSGS